MIKSIIVDDEQHCIDRLQNLLHKYCSTTIQVAGAYQTVEDALKAIKEFDPALVFLDIRIHNKTSFDLLKQLNEIRFDIIFTTAYDEYGVQAIKFSVLEYLLKPIGAEDLIQAINKLKEKVAKEETAKKLDALFRNLQNATKKISVPTSNGYNFIDISDIIHCQSDGPYTNIFLKDKSKIVVSKTLKDFEELLANYDFYRVHASHLINLSYVKNYNKGKGSLCMTDNSVIEVSTRRKDDFFKKLQQFIAK